MNFQMFWGDDAIREIARTDSALGAWLLQRRGSNVAATASPMSLPSGVTAFPVFGAPTTAGSGVVLAMTVIADTAYGGNQVSIGGTAASASAATSASQHNAAVQVKLSVTGSVKTGYQIPANFDFDCGWASGCNFTDSFTTDCEADGGAEIDQFTIHSAVWQNGVSAVFPIDRSKQCKPLIPGGGGTDEGGDTGCETYVIEVSNDGGGTWTELARVDDCS